MKPQQPYYRFPTLDHARVWREIADTNDPLAAGIVNRVAAAVLVACPHLDPVNILDRLWLDVDGASGETLPEALSRLHALAMLAGLVIVAGNDDPPPPAQAMAV